MFKIGFALAAAFICTATDADGADIRLGTDNIGRSIISLEGPIVGGDGAKLESSCATAACMPEFG
jgi:hypothetical protein